MRESLQEAIDIVASNSIKLLNEDALPADAAAIQSGANKMGDLITRIFRDSIIEQVCDIQPTFGPSGIVYYTTRTAGKLGTASKNFDIDDGVQIIGKFNTEWWQDYFASTKKDPESFALRNIMQDIKEETDTKFIAAMNNIATVVKTITFTAGSLPLQDEFMNLIGAFNLGSGMISKETERGYNSYVICSPKVGAAMVTAGLVALDESTDGVNTRYLGRIGVNKIFIDTTASEEYMIVGHKGPFMGDSTFIYSPYAVYTKTADDYSTEEVGILVHSRFKLVRNPLDNTGVADSKFAKKFLVNFSGMTNF